MDSCYLRNPYDRLLSSEELGQIPFSSESHGSLTDARYTISARLCICSGFHAHAAAAINASAVAAKVDKSDARREPAWPGRKAERHTSDSLRRQSIGALDQLTHADERLRDIITANADHRTDGFITTSPRLSREWARGGIGVHVERVPLSGASRYRGNGADVDVYARGKEEAPFVCEVKSRKNGPRWPIRSLLPFKMPKIDLEF